MELLYSDISKDIIACAYTVYNHLGPGFLESVYHKSLVIELEKNNFDVQSEIPYKVIYNDHIVGDFKADLLVNDLVIIELKAIENLAKAHEVQLVNYLACSQKPIGLLINFSPSGVIVKRRELINPHSKLK